MQMSKPDQLQPGQLIARSHLSSIFSGKVNECTCVIKVPASGSDAALSVQREKSALSCLNSSYTAASTNAAAAVRNASGSAYNQLDGKKHIVQLLGSYSRDLGDGLVLEQLGHSLHQILRARELTATTSDDSAKTVSAAQASPLPIACVKQLAKHLFLALHYVHSNGWIHRDVKPANLMTASPVIAVKLDTTAVHSSAAMDGEQQQASGAAQRPLNKKPSRLHSVHLSLNRLARTHWKLIDFGNAVQYHAQHKMCGTRISSLGSGTTGVPCSLLQTPAYAAPEDLLGVMPQHANHAQQAQHATSALAEQTVPWAHPGNDMWAAGCVLYEAATGCKLFDVRQCRALLQSYMCQQHRIPHSVTIDKANNTNAFGFGNIKRQWQLQFAKESLAMVKDQELALPIEALGDDDIQLWQMVYLLGPIEPQVVSRACLQTATGLDAEGYSRLDHHPAAQAVKKAASSLHTSSFPAAGTERQTKERQICQMDPGHDQGTHHQDDLKLCAVLPLQQRLCMEGSHISEEERVQLADLLSGLLRYSPEGRLTAVQALTSAFLADCATRSTNQNPS